MMTDSASTSLIISTFVDLFVFIFNGLIIARVLMSYFVPESNGFYQGLINLTEPILAPLRKALPRSSGVDFAPLAAFFLLQGIQILAHNLLGT
jgi:YggT family protein